MGLFATTTSLAVNMLGYNFDTATTALATKKITDAENEIKKYLSKRYSFASAPFTTYAAMPPLIISLCEKLAEGYMYRSNSRGGKESLTRGKELITEALENLKMIRDYKSDLLNASDGVVSEITNTAYAVKCNTSNYSETFNEDDEKNWAIDSDKLDDIADARD